MDRDMDTNMNMDTDVRHGHRHGQPAWTWTRTFGMDMDTDVRHGSDIDRQVRLVRLIRLRMNNFHLLPNQQTDKRQTSVCTMSKR
jgi:hypothetical protein